MTACYVLKYVTGVMRSALLCGASSSETPLVGGRYSVSLRITERDVKEVINLSVALNRPERSRTGEIRWRDTTSDRMTSSFDGAVLGTDVPIMRSGFLQDLHELADFAGRNRGTAVAELLSSAYRDALHYACWCRLTQPERRKRKKATGGGSGSMAEG